MFVQPGINTRGVWRIQDSYCKSSIKPPGVLIHFRPIWGGLNREKTMVSVLHKELEYKVEKLKYKSWRSCSQASESNPNFQLVNKPSWISPNEVLQSWLINTVYHNLLVKNNHWRGEGLNRGEGLFNFLPLKVSSRVKIIFFVNLQFLDD